MKNLVLTIALIGISLFSTNLYAQKDRTLKNGISLNLNVGFPNNDYGIARNGNTNYTSLWGIQFGNRWYIKPATNFGFGVMVNWIDISFAFGKTDMIGIDGGKGTLDLSLIEVGPIGTYAINRNMALDGYYNLRPTIMATAILDSGGDGFTWAGTGFTHAVGVAYRINVFSIGLEHVFGRIRNADINTTDDPPQKLGEATLFANNVRLIIGVKF